MKKTFIVALAALMFCFGSEVSAIANVSDSMVTAEDKKPAKKKKEVKEVIFRVHLHCEDCVNKVKENIAFEKGVKDLNVSLEYQTVTIKFDASKTSEDKLKAAIEKLGYPVAGVVEPGHEHEGHHHHDHQH